MLRKIEKETLTEGMYVRFVVNLRDISVMEKLIGKLKRFKNIKHMEKLDDDQLLFVLLAIDESKQKHFSEVVKLSKRIFEILEPTKWFNIHYVTTNKGSYAYNVVGTIVAHDENYYEQNPKFEVHYVIPDSAFEGNGEKDGEMKEALRAYRFEHKRLRKE